MSATTIDGHEIKIGKDGRRRVRNPGGGFPIIMLDGETPEQAITRHHAKRAENAAARAAEASAETIAGAKTAERINERVRQAASNTGAPDTGNDPRPRVEITDDDQAARARVRKGVPDELLTATFAQLLSLPAIWYGLPVYDPESPGGMRARCSYCAAHFQKQGPQTAREIIQLAEHNPNLRGGLEKIHNLFGGIGPGMTIANYAGPPLLHHAAPEPILNAVGPILGVPPRPHRYDAHDHEHEPDAADTAPPPEPAVDPSTGTIRAQPTTGPAPGT